MSIFRYLTAGESHGPQLNAIIEGLPAGIHLSVGTLNHDLARRQQGYGRGDRMKIEKDTAQILSGVRWGETIGSPVALVVMNRDWENWSEKMSSLPEYRDDSIAVTRPRPGHAGPDVQPPARQGQAGGQQARYMRPQPRKAAASGGGGGS